MKPYETIVTESRRLFILRLLVEVRQANESVIYRTSQQAGFERATRDEVRQDLDLLRQSGCTREEWLNANVRVVAITERGEEAAHGRVDVAGVECSPWDR